MAGARKQCCLQGLQHLRPALKPSLGSNISVLEKKRIFFFWFTRGAGVFPCAYDEQLLCGHVVQ